MNARIVAATALGCLLAATVIAQEKLPAKTPAISVTGAWNTDAAATAICRLTDATCVAANGTPDGVALSMVLFVSGTDLTGSITDLVAFNTFAIEEGRVVNAGDLKPTEIMFEFTTYRRVSNVMVGTHYKGRLVNPTTIELGRSTPSGRPVDVKTDGSPQLLVFRRAKDPQ